MRLKGSMLVVAALVVVGLVAATVGVAQTPQPGPQAMLRAVHAVPNAPSVDVIVDGNRAFSNVSFGQATDYAVLPAGGHSVQVVPAGAGAQQALINTNVNLGPGSYNTLAAVGQPNSVRPLTLVNDNTLPVLSQSKVRVVHASPNAPAVDVAVQGGPVLFNNATFPNATPYETVEARTWNLEIRQAGTNNVVKSLPNVTLNGATVYTIFAVGLLNGQPPLDALVVVDAPPLQACRQLVGAPAAGTPAATPGTPVGTPTTPAGTPTTPAGTPTTPVGTPTTPVGTPTTPAATPGTPARTPGTPAATPRTPAATPGTPAAGTPQTGTTPPSTP